MRSVTPQSAMRHALERLTLARNASQNFLLLLEPPARGAGAEAPGAAGESVEGFGWLARGDDWLSV